MNPLLQLYEHGQSLWLDNLTRGMIASGELARRVREEGVRGVTSNPAIFHKAISRGGEYDDDITALAKAGASVQEIYENLVVHDIRAACDVLLPLWDATEGGDGFVSLEVSPYLIHDSHGTLVEARRLHGAVNRPNLLIKIPGSPAGVRAIEQALYEGINVNITLLFAVDAYEAVAEAYLKALERRLAAGLPVDHVASVASFFVSRIDTLVDQLLGHRLGIPGQGPRAAALLGSAATANARLAYASFQRFFSGQRWEELAARGARVQRLLWASTSTKDPLYDDVRYVAPLVGRDTVNTMPEETIAAFAHHGRLAGAAVASHLEEARAVVASLAELGIDLPAVTTQLLNEGAQKFMEPFDALMASIAARREQALGQPPARLQAVSPAAAQGVVAEVCKALDGRQFSRRLWAKDTTLWSLHPKTQEAIAARLGWLDAIDHFAARQKEIQHLADQLVAEGVRQVVLLGMGGSSLCPEVCAQVFGAAAGRPTLRVLDSTDPDAVSAVEREVEWARTLFLVASKSGTTVETACLQKYFWAVAVAQLGDVEAGRRFIAITDPATPLAAEGRRLGFRAILENPPDIGGRFSALSYFGLLPMALLGIDTAAILARARRMALSCGPEVPAFANPGVRLGAILGSHARRGRPLLALVLSPALRPFAAWVEQLVAESTGKDGKGILPVTCDTPGVWPAGARSVFVAMSLRGQWDPATEGQLEELGRAGHPVVRLELEDRLEMGAEFLRWEIATATAGAVLGVNPFDEPNVTESKAITRSLLAGGGTASERPAFTHGSLQVFGAGDPGADLTATVHKLFASPPAGWGAILAFFAADEARSTALEALRAKLAARLGVPVTAAYGPRYLHSTGQLHKGGPADGAFLILTCEPATKIHIPGEPFDFRALLHAQAVGDGNALRARGRRALRVHLGVDAVAGLAQLTAAL